MVGLLSLASVGRAFHFDFNVQYEGGGIATLLAGDNPTGTVLQAGDTFNWDIQAQGSGFWEVITGADFFPLMAFGTYEDGFRTGNFTLTLSNNGATVYTQVETGSVQSMVHIGTNEVPLVGGLIFDRMHLSYSLTSAIEAFFNGVDWEPGLLPVDTTLTGLLPIFGAPEATSSWSNGEIVYRTAAPVPDLSSTLALLVGAMSLLGAMARRTRRA